MPVVFNGGNKSPNEQPKNEVIKRIVTVIQKIEEEINTNKRTINSKVNGNSLSLTQKIRDVESVIESIDVRVSTIGEKTPDELTTEPIREMISQGYLSIQVKGSADLLNKATELVAVDHSLDNRISEEVKTRESVALSLATDIVSMDERTTNKFKELSSRIDGVNTSHGSPQHVLELIQTVNNLTAEVERLKTQNSELSAKLDKEIFTEMTHRTRAIESINSRLG